MAALAAFTAAAQEAAPDPNAAAGAFFERALDERLQLDPGLAASLGLRIGYDRWPVTAAAAADVAYGRYEVALVLDTTGSMAGGKLAAMKDAVEGLIDSMSSQVKGKDRLKFALVPFSTFVNVGPQFGPEFKKNGKQKKGTGAPWLDLEGASPIPQTFSKPSAGDGSERAAR